MIIVVILAVKEVSSCLDKHANIVASYFVFHIIKLKYMVVVKKLRLKQERKALYNSHILKL